MAINFPNSPTNGETVTAGTSVYTYNSAKGVWNLTTSTVVGPTGPQGATGATGPTGATGAGATAGGTAGQVLTKVNSTDYNATWSTVQPITLNGTAVALGGTVVVYAVLG